MEDKSNNKQLERINELEAKVEESAQQIALLSCKLLEAESQRSSFLSHILNEINNPLTSILGLTNNIRRMAYSSPESVHKQANLAYEQAYELDYKMRNVFAAAAIEAGTATVRLGKVDVSEMLEGVIQDLHFKSSRKDLDVRVDKRMDTERHFGTDPSLLHAMLLNLIGNAIEFSPKGDSVKITLEAGGMGILFTIEDNGSGIDKNDQKLIFGRFKQLDEGVTKTHQGTGLGLSIVKEYTDLLGGTLDIISEKGEGSIFILALPEIADHSESFEEVSFGDEELF
ncbi:MAG: HAMP domain-containing sensor histidine kinase [Bacteroidota bacterium]